MEKETYGLSILDDLQESFKENSLHHAEAHDTKSTGTCVGNYVVQIDT